MKDAYQFKQKFGFWKLFNMTLIIVGLFYGMYLFMSVEDRVAQFKFSHITKIYVPLSLYRIEHFSLGKTSSQITGAVSSELGPELDSQAEYAENLPILVYHGVVMENDDIGSDYEGADITIDRFREQMFVLKKAGYSTITIEEFTAFMKEGKKLPEKSFLLTFDDGKKSSYYPVDPILRTFDYTAVMFVITNKSLSKEDSKSYYLSEEELHRMLNSGRWELQSHGNVAHYYYEVDEFGNRGHFLSSKTWVPEKRRIETDDEFRERIRTDLKVSKKALEEMFGIKVTTFAFPFSDFGQGTLNFKNATKVVSEETSAMYTFSFYQHWAGNGTPLNVPDENIVMIKRIHVEPWWEGKDILYVFEKNYSEEEKLENALTPTEPSPYALFTPTQTEEST